ncbi:hypothetical protein BpHYR1_022748 [Brachionus plicatilis]|uniref:Uncharacterized protein n=1 Tax=Brachionus plicatilis TaxID=10195 RepID=A0A3M7TAU9_BRAPC|nr:hypothetical protein BpHYR1_022748 [Brachionus plicatilis]
MRSRGKICKSLQKNYPLKIASLRWSAFCIVHIDIAELFDGLFEKKQRVQFFGSFVSKKNELRLK